MFLQLKQLLYLVNNKKTNGNTLSIIQKNNRWSIIFCIKTFIERLYKKIACNLNLSHQRRLILEINSSKTFLKSNSGCEQGGCCCEIDGLIWKDEDDFAFKAGGAWP